MRISDWSSDVCSSDLTTPQGALCQSRICGAGPSVSTSTSSVDPPPMSKMSAGPSPGSSRMWQPSTARRASSSAVIMSSAVPVSRYDRKNGTEGNRVFVRGSLGGHRITNNNNIIKDTYSTKYTHINKNT